MVSRIVFMLPSDGQAEPSVHLFFLFFIASFTSNFMVNTVWHLVPLPSIPFRTFRERTAQAPRQEDG